ERSHHVGAFVSAASRAAEPPGVDEGRATGGDGTNEPRRSLRAGPGGSAGLALSQLGTTSSLRRQLLLVFPVQLLATLRHLGVSRLCLIPGLFLATHRFQTLCLEIGRASC